MAAPAVGAVVEASVALADDEGPAPASLSHHSSPGTDWGDPDGSLGLTPNPDTDMRPRGPADAPVAPTVAVEEVEEGEGEGDPPTAAVESDLTHTNSSLHAPRQSLGLPPSPRISDAKSPTKLFKNTHIFVEMDELRVGLVRNPSTHQFQRVEEWQETHRWNFGLQEDLDELGVPMWNHPHLPWCSAVGMANLRERLGHQNIFLDVPGMDLDSVARNLCSGLSERGLATVSTVKNLIRILHLHAGSRRRSASVNSEDDGTDRRGSGEMGQSPGARRRRRGSPARHSPSPSNSGGDPQRTTSNNVDNPDYALGRAHAVAEDEVEFELLCPEEMEEAADVLVGEADWLDDDLVLFARLRDTVDARLERHCPTRFLIIVLGPPGDENHIRHVQMGEAAAVLMQDELCVQSAYRSTSSEAFLEACDLRMNKLTVIPHIHRPTEKGLHKRMTKMKVEMADHTGVVSPQRWVGGEWDALAENVFDHGGYTLTNWLLFMEKYALPMLLAILLALMIKNIDPEWYTKLEAYHPHEADAANVTAGAHRLRRAGGGADGGEADHGEDAPPTLYGLEIDGHPVTLHFLANDVLMNFHFAIATAEIVESFLPGAFLYPPTRAAVNPLCATLGGMAGPVIFFYIFTALFDAGGGFDNAGYSYDDVVNGWAVPTATDTPLAWVIGLLAFGPGHPAISYLLFLAVVDDAVVIVIIALAYTNQDTAKLVWLLLVVLAMALAYGMRRLKFMDWRPYIFIAGPVAWYGMLRAGLHPAISLTFIVPFMPTSLERRAAELAADDVSDPDTDDETASLTQLPLAEERRVGEGLAAELAERAKIPLFHFEHQVKYFVDWVVLVLFGLCSAGVDVTEIGPFTAVIYLSATVGKTVGIALTGWLLEQAGFKTPGLNVTSLLLVGGIGSIGLTVSLFVAGAAYENAGVEGQIQSQAKLGVLFALANGGIAILIGRYVNVAAKVDESTDDGLDDDGSDSGTVTDDDDNTDDDEFLEHVIAIEYVDRLERIHEQVKEAEEQTQVTRRQFVKSMKERLKEMEMESHQEEEVYLVRRRTASLGGHAHLAAREAARRAVADARLESTAESTTE
eukprot:m.457166 g.457166  ORF g.457166 m.457166 type:complete len:1083 (+) comp21210_c0_seq1:212-3460(+)